MSANPHTRIDLIFSGLFVFNPMGAHLRVAALSDAPEHLFNIQIVTNKPDGTDIELFPDEFAINQPITFQLATDAGGKVDYRVIPGSIPILDEQGPISLDLALLSPRITIKAGEFKRPIRLIEFCKTPVNGASRVTAGPVRFADSLSATLPLEIGQEAFLKCNGSTKDFIGDDTTTYQIIFNNNPATAGSADSPHAGHRGNESHFRRYFNAAILPADYRYDIGVCDSSSMHPDLEKTTPLRTCLPCFLKHDYAQL